MNNPKIKVRKELKRRTLEGYSDLWYDSMLKFIDEAYTYNTPYDFDELVKPRITNKELQEFCKQKLELEISPKRSSQLFKDYLIANKIKHFRGNTRGVRHFQLHKI